jgi:pimeloyl-ACP methyl ester carboxylesterase
VPAAIQGIEPPSGSSPSGPLRADPPIAALPVEGFPDAVVSVPLGATSPRPVIIAAHGLWDPPEGLCDNWRWTVGDRAWVLCPRGRPVAGGTFKYDSGPALAKEIDAGLAALRARYPGYVDDGPVLYTGFSLGAILGVSIVAHDPKRFPRAVLIEGGEDKFASGAAAEFAHGGGQRVLFACGLKARVGPARHAAEALEHAGVSARVVFGRPPDAGEFMHWYNGPVAEEIRSQLDWLFEGDQRWTASP